MIDDKRRAQKAYHAIVDEYKREGGTDTHWLYRLCQKVVKYSRESDEQAGMVTISRRELAQITADVANGVYNELTRKISPVHEDNGDE